LVIYLDLKDENGFDREISKSIAKHKNQASDAISKNSKVAEGNPQ
jgi:hypothetical protein